MGLIFRHMRVSIASGEKASMAGRAHVSQVRKTTKPHTDLRRGKRLTLIEGLWGRI